VAICAASQMSAGDTHNQAVSAPFQRISRGIIEARRKQEKARSLIAPRNHSFPQCGQRLRDYAQSLFYLFQSVEVAFQGLESVKCPHSNGFNGRF